MQLDWLAESAVRQLLNRACLRTDGPLHRLTEATAVSLLESVFSGSGYLTSREIPFPDKSGKVDLTAEHGGRDWWIEGKVIWDGGDARLNRKRFMGENGKGREILGDLDRLVRFKTSARCVAVWFAFSESPEILRGANLGTIRLGDALDFALQCGVEITGRATVTLDDRTQWRYGNIFCFEPT